jgi:hypothetical protein
MNSLANKSSCLKDLKEVVQNFKALFETNKDPFWEQAVRECILERDLVKSIPDDENFVINRARLLLMSGLYNAAEKRLNAIAEK